MNPDIQSKKTLFEELAAKLGQLSGAKLKYAEGIICAYTLTDNKGDDFLELQTDYGDHLDLLVIIEKHPYSLGGDYIHGSSAWEQFKNDAIECMKSLFSQKTATEEQWYRGNKRIGGQLYVPSAAAKDKNTLVDRTGSQFRLLSRRQIDDHFFASLEGKK